MPDALQREVIGRVQGIFQDGRHHVRIQVSVRMSRIRWVVR